MADRTPRCIVGWDIGGAHVKACLVEDGQLRDIAQWACPLWLGLIHLDTALVAARQRWPQPLAAADTLHVATMTGEMADLFTNREDGVRRLSAHLAERLGPSLRLYAGDDGAPWVAPHAVGAHWAAIASANWRATATLVGRHVGDGVLIDIGSTTADLIVLRAGAPVQRHASDAQRLASGALVYQGVVRTPLCALARRVPFAGDEVNVMNEFFATTADVYRLCGELDPEHDQQPSADNGPKDPAATRQRLARMIGRDAREAADAAWLVLAQHWRSEQIAEIAGQLARVLAVHPLPGDAPVVGAGCGDFLAAGIAARLDRPYLRFGADLVLRDATTATSALARWAQVCAPAVAVACLAADGG